MTHRFTIVDVFTERLSAAISWPCLPMARHSRCADAGLCQGTELLRDDLCPAAAQSPAILIASASSRRIASCPSPAIPMSARRLCCCTRKAGRAAEFRLRRGCRHRHMTARFGGSRLFRADAAGRGRDSPLRCAARHAGADAVTARGSARTKPPGWARLVSASSVSRWPIFDAVSAARSTPRTWSEAFPVEAWATADLCRGRRLCPRRQDQGQDVGPSVGVAEDPATGAAAAVLAGSLAAGLPERDGDFSLVDRTGCRTGRPSFYQASAEKRDGCSRLDPRRRRLGYRRRRQLHRPLGNSMAHRFLLVDVFTQHAFGWQPACRVSRCEGYFRHLDASLCEGTEFSETTFVLPRGKPGHTHRVRSSHRPWRWLRRTPEYRHRYCSRQRTSRRQPRIR